MKAEKAKHVEQHSEWESKMAGRDPHMHRYELHGSVLGEDGDVGCAGEEEHTIHIYIYIHKGDYQYTQEKSLAAA